MARVPGKVPGSPLGGRIPALQQQLRPRPEKLPPVQPAVSSYGTKVDELFFKTKSPDRSQVREQDGSVRSPTDTSRGRADFILQAMRSENPEIRDLVSEGYRNASPDIQAIIKEELARAAPNNVLGPDGKYTGYSQVARQAVAFLETGEVDPAVLDAVNATDVSPAAPSGEARTIRGQPAQMFPEAGVTWDGGRGIDEPMPTDSKRPMPPAVPGSPLKGHPWLTHTVDTRPPFRPGTVTPPIVKFGEDGEPVVTPKGPEGSRYDAATNAQVYAARKGKPTFAPNDWQADSSLKSPQRQIAGLLEQIVRDPKSPRAVTASTVLFRLLQKGGSKQLDPQGMKPPISDMDALVQHAFALLTDEDELARALGGLSPKDAAANVSAALQGTFNKGDGARLMTPDDLRREPAPVHHGRTNNGNIFGNKREPKGPDFKPQLGKENITKSLDEMKPLQLPGKEQLGDNTLSPSQLIAIARKNGKTVYLGPTGDILARRITETMSPKALADVRAGALAYQLQDAGPETAGRILQEFNSHWPPGSPPSSSYDAWAISGAEGGPGRGVPPTAGRTQPPVSDDEVKAEVQKKQGSINAEAAGKRQRLSEIGQIPAAHANDERWVPPGFHRRPDGKLAKNSFDNSPGSGGGETPYSPSDAPEHASGGAPKRPKKQPSQSPELGVQLDTARAALMDPNADQTGANEFFLKVLNKGSQITDPKVKKMWMETYVKPLEEVMALRETNYTVTPGNPPVDIKEAPKAKKAKKAKAEAKAEAVPTAKPTAMPEPDLQVGPDVSKEPSREIITTDKTPQYNSPSRGMSVTAQENLRRFMEILDAARAVSYTHLTLPTNREV